MKALTLLLLPAALFASQPRHARLGEFQGKVEVQLTAADPWMPAERNLPLMESAWVRTAEASRVEIELDDGSAWRLGPDSLGEISDYTLLSTGQRVTLLSLDHGTAWFSGEPHGNDVLMLVAPGAQVTLGQGARVRCTAATEFSQFAVLEGMVRFSSPSAEMGLREGHTARVEPANEQRFFLYPEVTALELDRWSEARDKAEAAPPSASHVTWRYGLADLDTMGDWMQTQDADVVWKPRVADTWKPYQQGRWRYYDSLGYTWVSDDAWGWLPYHNGRWTRRTDLGWVWQPAVSTVFKPGEVYWLTAAGLAGWGPLAPGELWTPPLPAATNPPRHFAAGITTWAAVQPDARTIDPAGFAAAGPEQLKATAFAPAPPSPAFLATRLEATRPVLKVGSTRIKPIVPGVTFSDPPEPASSLMTNPPGDPGRPTVIVSDAPPTTGTPPDGVYPVPAVAIPVIEVPVVVNPPEHPDYSRGRSRPSGQQGQTIPTGGQGNPGNQNNQGSQQTGTAASSVVGQATPATRNTASQPVHEHAPPAPATPPPTPSSVTSNPAGNAPVHEHPAATTPPAAPPPARETPRVDTPRATPSKIETPKAEPAKTDAAKSPDKKLQARVALPGEQEIYNRVLRDITPPFADLPKALADLDAWTRQYPRTDFEDDRRYYYVHAYRGLNQPDRILEAAEPLVAAGVPSRFDDKEKVLQILLATAASLQNLPKPTSRQLATGQRAARQLLDFLPDYFAPKNRPAVVSDSAWQLARVQLEGLGKQALAKRGQW